MKFKSNNTRIVGMSAVVPSDRTDNMSEIDDKKAKKLIKMTGIYYRHKLDLNESRVADMAIKAAKDVIEKSGTDIDSIRFLVYITQHPEFVSPATAFYVQKEIGLGIDCMVFDVNLGCSGFVAGLQIASSLISGFPDGSRALLINAEYLTGEERVNVNDQYLFGDGATATLIEKNDGVNSTYFGEYYSDGTRYQAIFRETLDSPTYMDGEGVFEFSVYEVSRYIKNFLEENGLSDESIDHIAFHQAQKFIIDHMATNARLDRKKLLYSLDEYANTSGASIPLSICRNRDILKEKGHYLLSGFGVGLAWGIAYVEIDQKDVFGVLEL